MTAVAAVGDHRLQLDVPTWADYCNGCHGDHIAQCACGRYEVVSSPQEGRYWHWLHRTNPRAAGITLLRLLVENPMPEGWTEPPHEEAAVTAKPAAQRRYTCPTCVGTGSIPAAGGWGGRFYDFSANEQAPCPDCESSGTTDKWPDPVIAVAAAA